MNDKYSRFSGICSPILSLFGFGLVLFLAGCQFEAKQRPVLEFDRSNPTANGSRYPVLASEGPDRVVMAWISSIEERVSTIEVADRVETQWYAPRPVHVGEDLGLDPSDRPQLVLDEEGTRWIAWRELRRGGRLVLSRQAKGSTEWSHFRIPVPDPALRQSVPRLSLGESGLMALWSEIGEEGTTLRLARWEGSATGDELRLDGEDGDGAWLAAGGPIRTQGELLGEPVLVAATDSVILAWIEREESRIELVTTRLPPTETESSPSRETIGEWPVPGIQTDLHGSLSMARQDGGTLALAATLEWGEERSSRLYTRTSGQWSERTPQVWNEQTGRTVIAADPEEGWILLWQQWGQPLATLWLQRLDADGASRSDAPLGDPVRVGSVDPGLQSDHPVMMPLQEEGIFLAWTQTDPFLRVRTALVPWSYEPDR